MTGTTETALLALAGVAGAAAKDVWVRVRTDRFESARLALERQRYDDERRRIDEDRERLRTEAADAGETVGVEAAMIGWAQIRLEEAGLHLKELEHAHRERDECREDVSVLRAALESVVAALVSDNRRLQARNDALEQRHKRREASRDADRARSADRPRSADREDRYGPEKGRTGPEKRGAGGGPE